jgi:hypothetical protein
VVCLFDVHTGGLVRRFRGHAFGAVNSVAFSADGSLLASAGSDTTALVWDVSAASRDLPRAKKLTEEDVRLYQGRLDQADAGLAYRAICHLAGSPAETVKALQRQLRPASVLDDARIPKLMSELDSEKKDVAEGAGKELAKLGEAVVPAVARALTQQKKPSRKVVLWLVRFQEELQSNPSPARLRILRAIHVLERIASPDALDLLRAMAKGDPDAEQTRSAREAVERLQRRGVK